MRVVHVNAHLDPAARQPNELLVAWPTLGAVASAVARAGASVTVLQAAHGEGRIERDGVVFEFIDATDAGPARIAVAAARLEPDVIHLHGLAFPHHLLALRAALPGTPLLVQDHANALPRSWRRGLWRRALDRADGFAFTTTEQAEPFVHGGVLRATMPVFAVPESSSLFRPGDARSARATLGIDGDPVVVWIGRLDPNKDPITALRGFALATRALPGARLWMCYGDATLLAEVRATIARQPALRDRVRLLGRLPHERIEVLLRAADLFIAASHRESSGYALIEALACGTTPVVSDIPSFRALLAGGRVGALFPIGDTAAMARHLIAYACADRESARASARDHFDRSLSADVLGPNLVNAYRALVAARSMPVDRRRPAVALRANVGTRRMRIAMVVPGGVDRSGTRRVIPCLLSLIERLAREVDLHVIALRQEQHATAYPLLGAQVHCLQASAGHVRALRGLLELNREFAFDAWHALWMHPQGTLAGAAGVVTRRPMLLHLNGGDLVALPDIGYGGRATTRGRTWLRAAVAAAAHITTPSEAMRRAAAALEIAAEVVTFGVATDRWPVRAPRARAPGEPEHLLHVANLNRVKDQPTLLRALAILRDGGVPFHADIIGEDTLGGEVQRMADSLGLDPVLRFHGALPHERTRAFFDRAHVLLIASRHEADPIVALEAAVAGVPTIGTHVGHLADWAPHAAITVTVGDAAALASATIALLGDDARRCDLARNAQHRALAMDANAGAVRVLELYEMLTGAARASPVSRTATSGIRDDDDTREFNRGSDRTP